MNRLSRFARPFCTSLLSTLVLLFFMPELSAAQVPAQSGYQMPPPEVAAIVDAAPLPGVSLSPDRTRLLLSERPSLPDITDLAQPELRLGGIRINPVTNGPSQPGYSTGLTLLHIESGTQTRVDGLPAHSRISSLRWSPDGNRVAFLHTAVNGIELWSFDVSAARAARIGSFHVNDAYFGASFSWLDHGEELIVRIVDPARGEEPQRPLAPDGPVIQENLGRAAPARTYQDLLGDSHDEALFEHYFSSKIIRTGIDGQVQELTPAGLFRTLTPSPDGSLILLGETRKPYSYTVPASRFPQLVTVIDLQGNTVHQVADLPLQDQIPIGFGATSEGPRAITWRNDAPATLVWTEAQDGGDPRVESDVRDHVYQLQTPFEQEPELLARLAYRLSGITWGHDNFALITERWWSTRTERVWKVQPANASETQQLLRERSYEDRYNDPGSFVLTPGPYGGGVLLFSEDHSSLYLTGRGASPEGDRPFLDRFDIQSGESERLWQSQSPWFETALALLDPEAGRVLLSREAVTEPPNYYLLNRSDNRLEQITRFEHPNPDLRDVTRELITYERADGVPLSGDLYLPPGYDSDRDGPLPMVIWAYPREFISADAAGQIDGSPYQFTSVGYWRAQWLITQGYAVLDNATMPIVAVDGKESNDTFVEQLIMNSEAAIQAMAGRGVGDPARAAIGGHSYGAFMTANVLAHSHLFRAGIARSGAYNRSLTPFGFQREERTIWDDTELYIRMSPFFHAHELKTPILLIHGAEDNNSGTFPMQSERLFSALQGLGGTARLVMLPHESHGYRARQSVMHMLWETLTWLDTYVKPHADITTERH